MLAASMFWITGIVVVIAVIGGFAAATGRLAGTGFAMFQHSRQPTTRVGRNLAEGKLSQAIKVYMSTGYQDNVRDSIVQSLPNTWDGSEVLVDVLDEMAILQRALAVARRTGVSPDLVEQLESDVQAALDAVGNSADLFYSLDEQQMLYDPEVKASVDRELAKLVHLTSAVHAARVELAEWTVLSKDTSQIAEAERRLRSFVEGGSLTKRL
jgi:hypothetical protein